MKKRKIGVGDIHGAAKALAQCFERSEFDFENDELTTMGDICDGWSEVYECVELLLKCKNRLDIEGNHDWWFKQWLYQGIHPVSWMHGGHTTAESYIRHAGRDIHLQPSQGGWLTNLTTYDIPDTHKQFFKGQISYFVDEKNRCFVHGGFDRNYFIKEQDPEEFLWNRSLVKKAMSCIGDQKLKTVDNFSEIFVGHTATVNWGNMKGEPITEPLTRGGVINLDTGAGWHGKLTFMDIDTKEIWQSDHTKDLYPNEKGRG